MVEKRSINVCSILLIQSKPNTGYRTTTHHPYSNYLSQVRI